MALARQQIDTCKELASLYHKKGYCKEVVPLEKSLKIKEGGVVNVEVEACINKFIAHLK